MAQLPLGLAPWPMDEGANLSATMRSVKAHGSNAERLPQGRAAADPSGIEARRWGELLSKLQASPTPSASGHDYRRRKTYSQPDYWDVTYVFLGREYRVQMTPPPGPTILVNRFGEPRV